MDVNINKDITKIQESLIFNLPLRESIFGIATIAIGFFTYMHLKHNYEGDKIIALITGVVSAPVAVIGFVKYQGLTAEKLLIEIIQSYLLPKIVVLEPGNIYGRKFKKLRSEQQKEMLKNDKIVKKEKK